MPCPFAGALGEPGKGIHSRRIFGLAFFDLLMTFIAAWFTIGWFGGSYWISLIVWFTVGEILHYLFGVQTAFLDMLGIMVKCD
jgi:hypothetical protein